MRSQSGFTLIEVLVTVAIAGVIIIGVLASYEQIASATMRNSRQSTVISDVSTAALRIHKDLFMALNLDVPDTTTVEVTDAQSVSFVWTDYVTTDWDGAGPMPPPPPEGTPHAITYSMAGTVLKRTYDTDPATIIGRHVSYLAFTKNGDLITVEITSTVAGLPVESETLEFTFHLRQGAQ